MYADRKNIPLEKVSVWVKHDRMYAKDCLNTDLNEVKGRIDKIEKRLKLEGDLTSQQKEELMKIADKCPIHITLSTPTCFQTEIVE